MKLIIIIIHLFLLQTSCSRAKSNRIALVEKGVIEGDSIGLHILFGTKTIDSPHNSLERVLNLLERSKFEDAVRTFREIHQVDTVWEGNF